MAEQKEHPMITAIKAHGMYDDGPITILFTFKVKPASDDKLIEIGRRVFPLVRQEEGCLAYQCYRSADDPLSFTTLESWTNGDAVAKHLTGTHTDEIKNALQEALTEPPVLKLYKSL